MVILPSVEVTVMAGKRREASWREVEVREGLGMVKRPEMLCSGLRRGLGWCSEHERLMNN